MSGPAPRARPAVAATSVLLGLLLVVLAAATVRDLAVAQGWAAGTPWSLSLVRDLDGLTATDVVVAVGVVLVLLGLLLVWVALKPARRTHVRTVADPDLWLSPAAVSALARGVADRVPGVLSVGAGRTTRRKVTVDVVTGQDRSAVTERVHDALRTGLQGATDAKIVVRAKEVAR